MKKVIKKAASKKPMMQKGGVKKPLRKAQTGWATGNAKPTYSRKFQSGTEKDYEGKDQISNSYEKIYRTTQDGKVISRSSASERANTVGGDKVTSYPQNTTVLDTSGYSQGKQSFPAKKATYNSAEQNYDWDPSDPNSKMGRSEFYEWDVPRSQVKKTIAEMKSNSGANKSKGTNVNYNSAGTKTVVHTGANGKKYVKVTTNDGKTYNKIMKTGGTVKKMQKGGSKTTVITAKSSDPYPSAIRANKMKSQGLALKAKGQMMKAKGKAMSKMAKGGVAKKPLRKAQTGTSTGTPFQQYMKTPGAVASDTVASRKPIEGSSVYYNNQLSKPVSKNPRNQGSLEKAFEKTYGMDVWDRQYDKSTKQKSMSPAQDKEMRRMGPMKKGGSVKKMAKGGTAHPGFKAVQAGIAAKQGVSKKAAGAILASATRKASPKAKAANPRLKRVKG